MTRPNKPAHHLRATTRPRAQLSAELIAEVVSRLTERDLAVIETVWEQRVLTTSQLAAIFFPRTVRAQMRLLELYRLGALLRFRPWTPIGTRPWHWVLGPAGAYVLAAQRGITVRELGYKTERALAVCGSDKLAHQIGVNQFFTDLHAHARQRDDGSKVDQWWSERRCLELWKGLARPDAFGRWIETQQNGHAAGLEFFLEHDTGSNPLPRLVKKLNGYAILAESTRVTTPVLFWLPSAAREANLRHLLTTTPIPVATAIHTPTGTGDSPAGPVWLPAGVTGPRRRLATLAEMWGGYTMPPDPTDPTGPGRT